MKKTILFAALILLLSNGCGKTTGIAGQQEGLLIAAAASLQNAFNAEAEAFSAQSGVTVTFSFGATGTLSQQMRNGAPFDLFAAADTAHVDDLIAKGYLRADSRAMFAQGELRLAFAPEVSPALANLEDLRDPRIQHVAIANPAFAPYGMAAQQALQAAGLWDALADRLVYGENVRQAFQFVESGNAQAGLLPLSLLSDGNLPSVPIAGSLYTPLEHGIAAAANSPHADAAQQFIQFLLSPQGREILAAHGLQPPEEAP